MRVLRLLLLLGLLTVCILYPSHITSGQGKAQISLQANSTKLQTGQKYPVEIRISGIKDLWAAEFELTYDPAYLYVVGTKAGSPVKQGDFFAPPESALPIFDYVKKDKINYTISMLAPAEPVSGDGLIGTFMIYPLAPGKTEIRFSKAQLLKENFATDEAGQRIGVNSVELPFVAVLLQLDITGDKVEPPSEATATPVPTETPTPTVFVGGGNGRTEEPTLENVTAVPVTPTLEPTLATLPLPTRDESNSALLLSVGLVVVSVLGLLIVLAIWLRSRRRQG